VCREQLPVWQELHQRYDGENVQIVAVAVDAQGPDLPRHYLEQSGVTFPVLLDTENVLCRMLGAKAIPNGLFIDEQGVLQYQKLGRFDVRTFEHKEMAKQWLGEAQTTAAPDVPSALEGRTLELYDQGLKFYREGRVEEGMALWREASDRDPHNFIIRKQLWAVENPEKFYNGPVDFDWQRDQIKEGR
jgi:thiol-disulfide isomerase/thioredoxin